jgi:hypothetical protein
MANHSLDAARGTHAAAASPSPEPHELPSADELRARAERYWQLSEILITPDVIEVVQACARELEAEASWIESAETSCGS